MQLAELPDYLDCGGPPDGTGGFPYTVPPGGQQTNTNGQQFGHSLDALGDVDADMRARIAAATPDHGEARFVTGGSDAQPPSA